MSGQIQYLLDLRTAIYDIYDIVGVWMLEIVQATQSIDLEHKSIPFVDGLDA